MKEVDDMNFAQLLDSANAFLEKSSLNHVSEEDALRPDLIGMKIYDEPIFGVASADSLLFEQLKSPEVVHPESMLPTDWLPEAKSVISFFLPFTETVKRSNAQTKDKASDEWLHARIEGQMMLEALGQYLCESLDREGYSAVFPTTDPRMRIIMPNVSNWSERHVAYACGLGTFGISRGLITKKGMAGRFGSIVTTAVLPVTEHEYSDPFEDCIMCGKCQKNCPVNAIDIKKGVISGKDQAICAPYIQDSYLPPHGPNNRVRYGCGKCQVNVPCESGIPLLKKKHSKD